MSVRSNVKVSMIGVLNDIDQSVKYMTIKDIVKKILPDFMEEDVYRIVYHLGLNDKTFEIVRDEDNVYVKLNNTVTA